MLGADTLGGAIADSQQGVQFLGVLVGQESVHLALGWGGDGDPAVCRPGATANAPRLSATRFQRPANGLDDRISIRVVHLR